MTKHTKACIALVFICIVWGTTYLAIRIGVRHYPPFLFAGIRQSVAGLLLTLAALYVNRKKDLSAGNIMQQMLVGFLMLTLGNGLVSFGLRSVPSGGAALICSLMPMFTVLFSLSFPKKNHSGTNTVPGLSYSKKDRFNTTIVLGLLTGIFGVGLIFRDNVADVANPVYLRGMIAILIATASWGLGTVMNKRHEGHVNPFFNSGLQLFFGGIFMLLISPFADDYKNVQLLNGDSLLSLAYLIIFGSALAYAAYMYSLRALPVGIATLYAYINPLIAVVAGAVFLGEELSIYTGMAFIAIAVSVYLMNRGYRQEHRQASMATPVEIEEAFPESVSVE